MTNIIIVLISPEIIIVIILLLLADYQLNYIYVMPAVCKQQFEQ